MTAGPRIIGGAWRGRKLVAPEGMATRPTSGRARQAVFDILLHAAWAGGAFLRGARVLDAFAGTGAYGLEALSRGAVGASFIELDGAALAALRANVAACRAADRVWVVAGDVLRPPRGTAHNLVFLDPPYGQGAVGKAVGALTAAGWLAEGAVVVAELGPGDEAPDVVTLLAERRHGKARLVFWKVGG